MSLCNVVPRASFDLGEQFSCGPGDEVGVSVDRSAIIKAKSTRK